MHNRKGFTLIELLAVITILGILMIVAIPAVSRTIENSRKDTFLSTAKQYANEVKTQWAADNITCTPRVGTAQSASGVSPNSYWAVMIDTKKEDSITATDSDSYEEINDYNASGYINASSLVEQGGKSSWGSSNLKGCVKIKVGSSPADTKYYVQLIDEQGRGIRYHPEDPPADELKRNAVSLTNEIDFKSTAYNNCGFNICTVNS